MAGFAGGGNGGTCWQGAPIKKGAVVEGGTSVSMPMLLAAALDLTQGCRSGAENWALVCSRVAGYMKKATNHQ
eukprot:scaffold232619_cov13-Tisochrysis_lutea.AAC.1